MDLWNLFRRRRWPGCGNRRCHSSVYILYQGLWNGESVVANGVLYPPITFMHGIGDYGFTILQTDYVSSCLKAQSCETKEYQVEPQTKKL